MERKRAAQKEINTIMTFVLMRSNAATIKPAIAFAHEHGIDYVNVVPMLAFTEDMVDEIFVWDKEAFTALHDELTAEAARLGLSGLQEGPPSIGGEAWTIENSVQPLSWNSDLTTAAQGQADLL